MLRIIPQSNASAARSYYSKADYYVDGPESSGIWGGKGAEKLGLNGEVAWKDFAALCDNVDPATGKPLTARTREDRRVLYDWNFHVPKSISLAFELCGDKRILEAFRDCVDETMRDAEAEMKVRVRTKGANDDRTSGNMVYATFTHRTSRPSKEDKLPDCHLHAHVTVFNCSFDEVDGKWKAGQFGELKKDAPFWQAQFHSRLSEHLKSLGYGITRTKEGFELSGVSSALVRKFSRRTSEIDALAKEKGITDQKDKDKLGALSRMGKSDLTMPDLHAYWQSRLSDADKLALRHLRGQPSKDLHTPAQAVELALGHCLERESIVPERQFHTELLKRGLGSANLEQLQTEAQANHELIQTEWAGKQVVSTRAVLQQEAEILDFARQGRGSKKPLAPDATVASTHLHPDQARAVQHVWQSPDRVIMIRGAAGVGKTTLTRVAVDGLEKRHIPVTMLAPSAEASRGVLRAEGFANADTVAGFLLSQQKQAGARNGVIWVDEAGLVSANDMQKLFRVAKQQDARVLLMGDTRQYSAISRGSLPLLEKYAGVPSVQVTDIKRQKDAYKQVTTLLAKGQGAAAFDRLDQMHWIHELSESERTSEVARTYLHARDQGSVLLIAPTRKEGAALTDAIRAKLKEKGALGEERPFLKLAPLDLTEAQRQDRLSYEPGDILQFTRAGKGHRAGSRLSVTETQPLPLDQAARFQAYRPEAIRLAVGDDIRMTANGKSLGGQAFNNGSSYRIKGFTKDGDIVLNNRWVVSKEFGHWSHNLVSTAVSSQGKTVDRVIISQTEASGRAANQAQFYVAVSRGKHAATVFTDSKSALREAVQRPETRISATEAFSPRRPPMRLARRTEMFRRWKHHLQARFKGKSTSLEKQSPVHEPWAVER